MNISKTVIFGQGKVGVATKLILKIDADFHDPFKGSIVENFNSYDLAIICVSSLVNGPNDHQAIEDSFTTLSLNNFSGLVALRCTVSPTYLLDAVRRFSNLKIVHFPEFMRQRDNDYLDLPWITVLGGNPADTIPFGNWLAEHNYGTKEIIHCVSHSESALIKLYQNAGLAMKVVFANIMYESCQAFGADYEKVRVGVAADQRVGPGHLKVPGDDGFGFAGHCLPKDVTCLNSLLDHRGFWDSILKINQELRSKNN
jgi:UDPglucose 6-dehydrogenase